MSWKDHTILSSLRFIISEMDITTKKEIKIQEKLLKRLDGEISFINNTSNVGIGINTIHIAKDPIWGEDSK